LGSEHIRLILKPNYIGNVLATVLRVAAAGKKVLMFIGGFGIQISIYVIVFNMNIYE
jgi:hypothetical protein